MPDQYDFMAPVINNARKNAVVNPEDFKDSDGLLVCGKCGKRKQKLIMRVKADDLTLLNDIHGCLIRHGQVEKAQKLGILLDRLEAEQERERAGNRLRAEKNRKNGYVLKSSHHPKHSKYQEKDE